MLMSSLNNVKEVGMKAAILESPNSVPVYGDFAESAARGRGTGRPTWPRRGPSRPSPARAWSLSGAEQYRFGRDRHRGVGPAGAGPDPVRAPPREGGLLHPGREARRRGNRPADAAA